jgi:SAM-dependent methyltransferase
MVPGAVLDRLRCPRCRGSFTQSDDLLSCSEGHRYPFTDGYYDFSGAARDSATADTFKSFGYEWTHFHETLPEDESYWQEYFAAVPAEELRDRVALDAGCGMGRFSRITARHVGSLVALDGSDAVVAAAANLAPLPNVVVVRSDLREPPLAEGSFDLISCLGVLHHLEDPLEGFRSLARLLAPGGIFVVYLYSRPTTRGVRAAGLGAATMLRTVTRRMPHPVLRVVSAGIAAGLYGGLVVGCAVADRMGKPLDDFPLALYRHRPLRALRLDTFDRLSAPIERRFSFADVEPWFKEAGLDVLSVSERIGLLVVGQLPAEGSEHPRSTVTK